MLNKWRENFGEEATMKVLTEALKKIRRKDLSDKMLALAKKQLLPTEEGLVSWNTGTGLKRANKATASQQMGEVKRRKRDPLPQFNNKSSEEQFKANKAVTEAVEDAQLALRTGDLEKIKEALDRGITFLQESRELILLADESPYGLKTKHYNLAEDEEDEKKIYRAESKKARAVKRSPSRTPRERRKSLPAVQAKPPQLPASQLSKRFAPVNQQQSTRRSASVVCFECGKSGHKRAWCPWLQQFKSA